MRAFEPKFKGIIDDVPYADDAKDMIEKNITNKIEEVIIRYAELIAKAIKKAIEDGDCITSINLDIDFYYLAESDKEFLFSAFHDLGYTFVWHPKKVDIIIK